MNFSEIKNLAKKLGGVVLLEEGEKSGMVVLSLEKYREITSQSEEEVQLNHSPAISAVSAQSELKPTAGSEKETLLRGPTPWRETPDSGELIEKLNRDIAALKEEIRKKELDVINTDPTFQPLTVDRE